MLEALKKSGIKNFKIDLSIKEEEVTVLILPKSSIDSPATRLIPIVLKGSLKSITKQLESISFTNILNSVGETFINEEEFVKRKAEAEKERASVKEKNTKIKKITEEIEKLKNEKELDTKKLKGLVSKLKELDPNNELIKEITLLTSQTSLF